MWSADPVDNNGYFKKMRTGYRGEWRSANLYSSESHEPALLFPFHVVLGRVAGMWRDSIEARTGETPPAWRTIPPVYDAARMLLVVAFFMALYWLTGELTSMPSRRLWGVAMVAFAGGVWPTDLHTEASILQSCIRFPNFVLSLLLYVLACGAFIRAMKRPEHRLRCAVWATIAGFGLGWTHPFDVPPLLAIGAAAFIWRWIQTRRLPLTLLIAGVCFAIASGAPILYQLSVKWREPVFQAMDAQNNLTWQPRWGWAPMLAGLLAVAAAASPFLWRRKATPAAMFVLSWIAVGLVMINLPVTFQRRMVEGLPIALALSSIWLVDGALLMAKFKRARLRLLRHVCFGALLLVMLPQTAAVLRRHSVGVFQRPTDLYYIAQAEADALAWLEGNSDWRDVVWAEYVRGNSIPYLSGNRVLIGHGVETIDFETKRAASVALFSGMLSREQFREVVTEYGVDYIYYGAREQRLARPGWRLAALDAEWLGEPVFRNELVEIYKVRRPAETRE